MKKTKFSLLLVLTLVLSLFLSACYGGGGNSAKPSGGGSEGENTEKPAADVPQEITVLETSAIPSLDSALAEDTISLSMLNNVGEGLYRTDKDQQTVDGVAKGDPEWNEDDTVATVKLNENAKWSNGDQIKASDFVFAWQRAINPETKSPYGPYMMSGKIKNAAEIAAGEMKPEELGIKAIDDTTLEITLVKPIAFFKSLMAFATFYPQNEKFVTEKGKEYGMNADNLVFNGPFVMSDWGGNTKEKWTMEKNDNYWDKDNVTLTKINFNVVKDSATAANLFDSGEADVTGKLSSDVVPQYEGDENLVKWLEPTIFWLKLNQKDEALANVNIRKAIAQGFNKEDLAASILNNGSVPANYAVPKEFVKHPDTGEDFREANGDMLTYNLEEAQKAWEQGLKEIGKKEVTLDYIGGDTDSAKKTDAYMKNQLEKNLPGLKINLKSVPFSVRLDLDTKMEYDIQFAGWGPDYADAISFSDLWITDGGSNRMAYSNPEYDKLLKQATGELAAEPGKRFEALQAAEKVLMDDAGLAPVYQRAANVLVAPKVDGFVYHLNGPEYSYKWIKVTE
ncbi:peptide ABC transporter substrate-binding protein [Metabacillus sp. 84]|uniref:peptide ABC transporter substrate-binding protein n=1 Tax=unclassified Metabacillus TaxID=2675274 RepID=UPI003CEEFCD3